MDGLLPYFDSVVEPGRRGRRRPSVNGNPAEGRGAEPADDPRLESGSGRRTSSCGRQRSARSTCWSDLPDRRARSGSPKSIRRRACRPRRRASRRSDGSQSLSVASVNGRTFIFSAEGTSGHSDLRVRERAAFAALGLSARQLPRSRRDGRRLSPHLRCQRRVGRVRPTSTSTTRTGSRRAARRVRRRTSSTPASPEHFLQYGFQALVSGTKAFVYRLAVPHANPVATALHRGARHLLHLDRPELPARRERDRDEPLGGRPPRRRDA